MSNTDKINALVQHRLNQMDLSDLEAFYVDVMTEEFEQLSEDMLNQIVDEELS